jgi:hypothetical protein
MKSTRCMQQASCYPAAVRVGDAPRDASVLYLTHVGFVPDVRKACTGYKVTLTEKQCRIRFGNRKQSTWEKRRLDVPAGATSPFRPIMLDGSPEFTTGGKLWGDGGRDLSVDLGAGP